jgi:hypothetical protein
MWKKTEPQMAGPFFKSPGLIRDDSLPGCPSIRKCCYVLFKKEKGLFFLGRELDIDAKLLRILVSNCLYGGDLRILAGGFEEVTEPLLGL